MSDNLIGFYNHVSKFPKATEACIESLRSVYPDAPVWLSIDGTQYSSEYARIGDKFNCSVVSNKEILGYPPYDRRKIVRWLNRMMTGVIQLGTPYFCMVEDDMLFLSKMHIPDNVQCMGHVIEVGNKIPGIILDEIERFSGVKPITDYYGAGGGSIFNTKTFIENYWSITNYIMTKWDLYEQYYYPQSGYMDCFMVLYFMLCGKSYTPNHCMVNLWPADTTSTPEQMKEMYQDKYAWLHNYKFHY